MSRAPVYTDMYKYLQCVWTAIICHTEYKERNYICNPYTSVIEQKIITASSYLVNVLVLLQTGVERETATQV